MPRLVDIDELEFNGCYDVAPWISAAQMEEAVIPPAEWIEVGPTEWSHSARFKCSGCGYMSIQRMPFCANCGRVMVRNDECSDR